MVETKVVFLFGESFIYGCFQKWWYPQIIHFNRVFHYKPSILGYPYGNIHIVFLFFWSCRMFPSFRALQDFGVASYEGGWNLRFRPRDDEGPRVAETYLPHFQMIAIFFGGDVKWKKWCHHCHHDCMVILFLLLLDLVGGQQNWCLQVKMLCFHLEFKIQWFILFHPYLGKIPIWTNIFQMRLKPPTSFPLHRPLN